MPSFSLHAPGIDEDFIESEARAKAGIIDPISFRELWDQYPDLHEEIILGFMRRGEVGVLNAAPKAGKSYGGTSLAWSMVSGGSWCGFDCKPGSVLYIDNELHKPTLSHRNHCIANAMHIDVDMLEHTIDFLSMRGQLCNLYELRKHFATIPKGKYQLIIIDALYRCLPDNTSESDNAQMTKLFNALDEYAERLGAAILVIHHTSKGAQGDKAVTDVGSGAGALSRAPDVYAIIREHEEPGLYVLETRNRSLPPIDPRTIKFDYPLWDAVTISAKVKRSGKSRDEKQKELDADGEKKILTVLEKAKLSVGQIRVKTGMGPGRVNRILYDLTEKKKVALKRFKPKTGGTSKEFYVKLEDAQDGQV